MVIYKATPRVIPDWAKDKSLIWNYESHRWMDPETGGHFDHAENDGRHIKLDEWRCINAKELKRGNAILYSPIQPMTQKSRKYRGQMGVYVGNNKKGFPILEFSNGDRIASRLECLFVMQEDDEVSNDKRR